MNQKASLNTTEVTGEQCSIPFYDLCAFSFQRCDVSLPMEFWLQGCDGEQVVGHTVMLKRTAPRRMVMSLPETGRHPITVFTMVL